MAPKNNPHKRAQHKICERAHVTFILFKRLTYNMYTCGEETMSWGPLKVWAKEGCAPPSLRLWEGEGGCFHLKCRHVSTFAIMLRGMPVPYAKAADNVVDEQCQQLIQEGALHQALEVLMEAYGTSVYAFCCNLLHDTSAAADILQTTFTQAFNHLTKFEKKLSFHTWLLTIARNRAVDHLRTIRRRERASVQIDETVDLADANPLADHLIHKQQMRRVLDQCLDELHTKTKDTGTFDILMLRFRENLPYGQISKMLGSSSVALRVRVARVLPKLKQCIESKGGRA